MLLSASRWATRPHSWYAAAPCMATVHARGLCQLHVLCCSLELMQPRLYTCSPARPPPGCACGHCHRPKHTFAGRQSCRYTSCTRCKRVACTPTPHAEQALSHAELLMGHTLRRVRLAVQLMCAQQYLSAACGNTMTSASMEHDSRDEQNISTSSCYDSAASQPCVDKGENMVKASMQNEPSHSRPASMQGEPDFLGEEVCSSWT